MKPRIRIYSHTCDCIRYVCAGEKSGQYHVALGKSQALAYKHWVESGPTRPGDWNHIPF